jgi:tRNA A-37 threonylcarbamoyl transferase component Bud32
VNHAHDSSPGRAFSQADAAREKRVLDAYDAVLDVPPAERIAFVERRHADDPELARALRELIAAGDRAEKIFDREDAASLVEPVLEDLDAHAAALTRQVKRELADALAGRYDIQETIGHGGMATVFLAFDKSLGRAVALKTIRPEMLDEPGIQRFIREVEIVARLEHPRIVPVYERGEVAGELYYIMRHVPGGSLADLLAARRQLDIATALRIARDVAEALDYAHAHHVIHRDIKPGNILLDDHGAYVADFGVARLVDAAGGYHRLTISGAIVGTAHYMSPELVDGPAGFDGRSDVYALACVVYEMLAGEPPYTGGSPRDILAKHLAASIPDVSVLRPTVNPAMQAVITLALQKTPADRFATAGEFVTALERAYASAATAAAAPVRRGRRWTGRNTWAIVSVAAAVVLLAAVIPTVRAALASSADPRTVLVLPFEYDSAAPHLQERQRFADAIRRWRGFAPADEFRVSRAFEGHSDTDVASAAPAIARHVGAGRLVRGDVSVVADSVRLHAAVYDSRHDALQREATAYVPRSLTGMDSAVAELTEVLLFGVPDAAVRRACRKTAVPDAYMACSVAHTHLARWDLAAADSAFAAALMLDPDYAQAHLELAQVRSWRREPEARWRSSAERADAARMTLSIPDQIRADAILSLARGNRAAACGLWERAVASTPTDYSAWYSLGACISEDTIVVRDPSSSSGWRFRLSYARALEAYRRAFLLQPRILEAIQGDLFSEARQLFVTTPTILRRGRSGDGTRFFGRAAWSGDSLLFIPFRADLVQAGNPATRPPSIMEAVRHEQRAFLDVVTSWAASEPNNPAAMEAASLGLEILADEAARDTLRHARDLASDPATRWRMAAHQVWLDLKFAVPDRPDQLASARALADSLLQAPPASASVDMLEALAVLTGRAALAARLAQRGSREPGESSARRLGRTLLVYAALGGPSDSLRAHERSLNLAIASLDADQRLGLRQQWGARAATLAFPDLGPDSLAPYQSGDDVVLDAQRALLAGDTAAARRYLRPTLAHRRERIESASYDGAWPELAMLVRLGDFAAAARQIDLMLAALPHTSPLALADAPAAGPFVRILVLRADVANRLGDSRTARQMATLAATLWSDADPFLQQTVAHLRSLGAR